MKKIISLCCISMMMFISTSFCFGQEQGIAADSISPKYIGTFLHIESFTSSGAILTPETILKPKEETSFDKVIINIRIKKVTTGTEYYNKNFTTYYDTVRNRFYATTNFVAPSKGAYRMDSTYRCYKNGELIETIKGDVKSTTY